MKNIIFLLVALTVWNTEAGAQTPYFQGKTIRFVVGYPAGSTHDLWARLVGPHMTKYIPGNPITIVQNMPGGYFLPKLLEETIGAKFTIVAGYQGGAEIELAVERGEVQCRAISIPVYFGREPFLAWQKKGLARILIQTGKKKDARLRDAPTLYELMDQYKTAGPLRRLADVMLSAGSFGLWPAMTSPNTPDEYVKTLRAAFYQGTQ